MPCTTRELVALNVSVLAEKRVLAVHGSKEQSPAWKKKAVFCSLPEV
jgi:hypothetical protein